MLPVFVPEGSFVKKGDLICELDVSDIEDRLDEQKLAVESADFTVQQAIENKKIMESQNDSLIKAAQSQSVAVAHRCTCKPWRFGPYACAWMKDGCGGGGYFPVVDDWPPAP